MNTIPIKILLFLVTMPVFCNIDNKIPTRELIGIYSNLGYATEYKRVIGKKLVLYRDDFKYFGFFSHTDNESLKTAPIENVIFDPNTGSILFDCLFLDTEYREFLNDQSPKGCFSQCKGIIRKDGIRLKFHQICFYRDSEYFNTRLEHSFVDVEEEFLPLDLKSELPILPIPYLSWLTHFGLRTTQNAQSDYKSLLRRFNSLAQSQPLQSPPTNPSQTDQGQESAFSESGKLRFLKMLLPFIGYIAIIITSLFAGYT